MKNHTTVTMYSGSYLHCSQNPDLNPKIQGFATFFTFNDSNS